MLLLSMSFKFYKFKGEILELVCCLIAEEVRFFSSQNLSRSFRRRLEGI